MSSPLKFLTRRRIRLLKLMWRGVEEIDSLSDLMFSRKNVIIRDLRALELNGIVEMGSNTARIIETPENLSLLVFLGIAKIPEVATRMARNLTDLLRREVNFQVDRVELTCCREGVKLRLYTRAEHSKVDHEKVISILEALGMDSVKVEFISLKESFNS